jgi:hypothetical protein
MLIGIIICVFRLEKKFVAESGDNINVNSHLTGDSLTSASPSNAPPATMNAFLSSVLNTNEQSSQLAQQSISSFSAGADKMMLSRSLGSFNPSQSPPKTASNGVRAQSQHGQRRAKTANPMSLRGLKKEELLHTLELSKVSRGMVFLTLFWILRKSSGCC